MGDFFCYIIVANLCELERACMPTPYNPSDPQRSTPHRRPKRASTLLLNWRTCWYLAESEEDGNKGEDRGCVRGQGTAGSGGVPYGGLRYCRRPGQGRVARRTEA